MAGTSSKSQKFEMRVPNAVLEAWKARAVIASTSVASLIIQSMEGPAPGPDAPVELRDSLTLALATKDAEIARLGKVVVSQQKIISKIPPDEVLSDLRASIAAKDAKIDQLEQAIVLGAGRSSGPLSPAYVVPKGKKGSRPAMAIDRTVHHPSGPVAKSAVPKARGDAVGFNLKTQKGGKR